jgi:uncharacterized membrane protein
MTAGALRGLRIAVIALAVASYPFVLVAGLDHLAARTISAGALAILLAAFAFSGTGRKRLVSLLIRRFGILLVLLAIATATDEPVLLKLLPSLTSLWLLATFALTLRERHSMVEQFAIASHEAFPDFLLPYCRRVTWVWCGFFLANAIAGIVLAIAGTPRAWALYTGALSYVLVGLLAAGEYVFHKSRFRFYEDGWADGVWRRLCPPERTALGRRTLEWQLARRNKTGADASAISEDLRGSLGSTAR